MKGVFEKRVDVALVLPNGATARGVAVVTGERWDGCTVLTLPSQFIFLGTDEQVVEGWPEAVGKPSSGEITERMAIAPLTMAVLRPLPKWPDGQALSPPEYQGDLFRLKRKAGKKK